MKNLKKLLIMLLITNSIFCETLIIRNKTSYPVTICRLNVWKQHITFSYKPGRKPIDPGQEIIIPCLLTIEKNNIILIVLSNGKIFKLNCSGQKVINLT